MLEREQPFSRAFAAPSEINGSLLEMVAPDLKVNLACNLKLDLVNQPPAELASRFLAEERSAVR